MQFEIRTVNSMMGIYGTPEACVERLHAIKEAFNPGRVICWFNLGGLVSHEGVVRSMELISSRVLPHL